MNRRKLNPRRRWTGRRRRSLKSWSAPTPTRNRSTHRPRARPFAGRTRCALRAPRNCGIPSMLNTLYIATASGTNPYANLALEEALLNAVLPGECILYLWQNQNTVVIGRNQNSRRECRVEALERDGGFLARRLSGGGAVFHDLGNLNFTFLVHREDYSVPRQFDVILRAVQALGIQAEKSGAQRPDSGRPQVLRKRLLFQRRPVLSPWDHSDRCGCGKDVPLPACFRRETAIQRRSLCAVPRGEPRGTGPGDQPWKRSQALTAAFGEVYHGTPLPFPTERLAGEESRRLEEKFASWEWRMGKEADFTYALSRRFFWGEITIQFRVSAGQVEEAAVYTDAMDVFYAQRVQQAWKGLPFTCGSLCAAVKALPMEDQEQAQMSRDIRSLLEECML